MDAGDSKMGLKKAVCIGGFVCLFASPGMGMSKESANLLDKALNESAKELKVLQKEYVRKPAALAVAAKAPTNQPATEVR